MADTMAQMAPPIMALPAPAYAKAGPMSRVTAGIARHPRIVLAVIVVLVVLLVWMHVKQNGLPIGPKKAKAGSSTKKKASKESVDAETEKLLAEIEADLS